MNYSLKLGGKNVEALVKLYITYNFVWAKEHIWVGCMMITK